MNCNGDAGRAKPSGTLSRYCERLSDCDPLSRSGRCRRFESTPTIILAGANISVR
jgi:hypothetical protein